MRSSWVTRCVVCGRRARYVVRIAEPDPTDAQRQLLSPDPSAMCGQHAQEAVPDVPLPRRSVRERLAAGPPPKGRKKHYEEFVVYTFLVLALDAIFWTNEVASPSAVRLAAGCVFAVYGAMLLFQAYVVRLQEKLERKQEGTPTDESEAADDK